MTSLSLDTFLHLLVSATSLLLPLDCHCKCTLSFVHVSCDARALRLERVGKLASLLLQVTLGRSRLFHASCCNRFVTRDVDTRVDHPGLQTENSSGTSFGQSAIRGKRQFWGRTAVRDRDLLAGRGFHGGNFSRLGASVPSEVVLLTNDS